MTESSVTLDPLAGRGIGLNYAFDNQTVHQDADKLGIARISFDRAARLNVSSFDTLGEIRRAAALAREHDDSPVIVV